MHSSHVKKHRRTASSVEGHGSLFRNNIFNNSTLENQPEPHSSPIPLTFSSPLKRNLKRRDFRTELTEQRQNQKMEREVVVEELDISINYRDPVFEFGRKKIAHLIPHLKKSHLDKENYSQLERIVEKVSTVMKTRVVARKKTPVLGQQKKQHTMVESSNSVSAMGRPKVPSKSKLKSPEEMFRQLGSKENKIHKVLNKGRAKEEAKRTLLL